MEFASATILSFAFDQAARALRVAVPAIGSQGNAWNNVTVAAGGTSAAVDVGQTPHITAFGRTSAATTITLQVSQNNLDWYNTGLSAAPGARGDFAINATIGARYVRLTSSAASTITATVAAKG